MSPSLQPPDAARPQGQGGGGFASSPGRENPQSMELLHLVHNIVTSSRQIAMKVPGAADIVRQINDLTQKLQMKLVQAGPGPEPSAPPQ